MKNQPKKRSDALVLGVQLLDVASGRSMSKGRCLIRRGGFACLLLADGHSEHPADRNRT